MNIFKTFLLTILNLIILPILIINIMSTLSSMGVNWSEIFTGFDFPNLYPYSYFGFNSFITAFEDFPAINTFFNGVKTLNNTWVNIIGQLYSFASGQHGIIETLRIVADILIAPITIVADILQFILLVLKDILDVLSWFIKLISGYYNVLDL